MSQKNLILRQTRFDYFLKNSLKQFCQTQRLAKVSISSLFYHVLTWLVVKFSSRAPFEIVMPVSRNISPFESRRRITSVATSARNLAAGNNGIFICPSSTRCPWSRFPPDHENEIFLWWWKTNQLLCHASALLLLPSETRARFF